MSPLFNQAIHELANLRLITSTSIMIERPYVIPGELIGLSIALGLHLELEPATTHAVIDGQVRTFEKLFGRLPDYLDGHQHQHLTPTNLPLVIAVAQEYSLPIRSRTGEDRALLKAAGIPTPDNFISWHPDRLSILTERLHQAKRSTISELVVHPGYYDPDCDYPYNQERTKELAFLRSLVFKEFLQDFQPTSYTSLKA